jgi:hypothetical protein
MFEKIKELLKEEMANISERYGEKKSYIHIDEVLAIIDEVASDTNVGHKNGWIPCSERLPDEYAEVLCYGQDGYVYLAEMYDTKIYGKVWVQWNGGDMRLDWIVAWQPLPEPYKEKK